MQSGPRLDWGCSPAVRAHPCARTRAASTADVRGHGQLLSKKSGQPHPRGTAADVVAIGATVGTQDASRAAPTCRAAQACGTRQPQLRCTPHLCARVRKQQFISRSRCGSLWLAGERTQETEDEDEVVVRESRDMVHATGAHCLGHIAACRDGLLERLRHANQEVSVQKAVAPTRGTQASIACEYCTSYSCVAIRW